MCEVNNNIKNQYIIHFLIYISLINIIFYINFKIIKRNSNFSPFSQEILNITIGNGKSAKLGIISDLQLDIKNEDYRYKMYSDNFYKSLKVLKNNNIDILIIAGDTTNNGKIENYLHFKEIFYSVYNNNKKPIIISIMGNNDYKDKKLSIIGNQKQFFNYMNSYPYSHYIINNYNFIFWSNDNYRNNEKGVVEF